MDDLSHKIQGAQSAQLCPKLASALAHSSKSLCSCSSRRNGLASDGNNKYPKVPSAVTVASIVQNLLSAVLIFLLLLGLRNLLKLK
jgi:hypothetical protein